MLNVNTKNLYRKARHACITWAQGNPPIDEGVLRIMKDEFWVLLYVSCMFLDLRENVWIFSLLAITAYAIVCLIHMVLFSVMAYVQQHDFMETSHSLHLTVLFMSGFLVLVFLNYNRNEFIGFSRAWSNDFFDYGDDFQIPELEDDIRNTNKTKVIILVATPTFLLFTGIVAVMRRPIDAYFGVASNETYIGGVYMLAPIPMWYPFEVDSTFKHVLVALSQIVGINGLCMIFAGADAAMIISSQTLALQLKILTYRLQKIQQCSYTLFKKTFSRKMNWGKAMFEDPDYMKCYNAYLNKAAKHHIIIIENFQRLQNIARWPTGLGILIGSIVIAMSLFGFTLGGAKPSLTLLSGLMMIAEILNIVMCCFLSDLVSELADSLSDELYNTNWIHTNMRAKRTMMIMIERSKRPLVLVAGVTPLGWETFSTVMETAYSYLNLLMAAKES